MVYIRLVLVTVNRSVTARINVEVKQQRKRKAWKRSMNLLMRCRYLEKRSVEYHTRLKSIREGMSQNLPGVLLVFDVPLSAV